MSVADRQRTHGQEAPDDRNVAEAMVGSSGGPRRKRSLAGCTPLRQPSPRRRGPRGTSGHGRARGARRLWRCAPPQSRRSRPARRRFLLRGMRASYRRFQISTIAILRVVGRCHPDDDRSALCWPSRRGGAALARWGRSGMGHVRVVGTGRSGSSGCACGWGAGRRAGHRSARWTLRSGNAAPPSAVRDHPRPA